MKKVMIILIILAGTAAAWATEEPAKKWSDEAELSFVNTSGNTELMTLSAKNLLKYDITKKLNTAWKASALYGEDDGEKNSETYSTELKFNYLITEKFFTLLGVGWLRDLFAGIKYRVNVGPGVGYKFFNGPKHFLVSEMGAEYVKEKNTEDSVDQYIRGRAFLQYDYALTEKNKFTQSLEYLHSFEESEDYNVISVTTLTSAINDAFSLKASYEVKYDNQPAVEDGEALEDTDRALTIALVMNF